MISSEAKGEGQKEEDEEGNAGNEVREEMDNKEWQFSLRDVRLPASNWFGGTWALSGGLSDLDLVFF